MEPAALSALRTLLGREPYLWQSRLFAQLLIGETPARLDVPTGLGKTAVIALWLTARALGAPLPRRLVYVVDRRVVVDQATAEAEALATRLGDGSSASLELARLRQGLDLAQGRRLPVSALRGRLADNQEWRESLVSAAIVIGTIDMIGSRLLFEGYGVSGGMRPAHAALLGVDALLVIDEAHLAPPFEGLVKSVAGLSRPAPIPLFRTMSLSATGKASRDEAVFRLGPEDEDPPVQMRVRAPKRLKLTRVENIETALVERALELGEGGKRVLVFCNSRDKLARGVAGALKARSRSRWKDAPTTALLVGARRGLERDELTGRRGRDGQWEIEPDPVFRRFMAGEQGAGADAPAFLVATSAGEVGVDLDADHMVCDLVAWERMVQRLGRVNRTGRPEPAMVDVFVAKPLKDDAEDEVEGRQAVLSAPFESPAWVVGEDGRRAAGPAALNELRSDPDFTGRIQAATTAEPLRPALTEALVEAWAMTSLDEHPGRPRVEPWIRGWVDTKPQTRVVWRRVLPLRGDEGPDRSLLDEFFAALPPHLSEVLETDTFMIASLAKARAVALRKGPGEPDKDLAALAAVTLSARGELDEVLTLADLAGTEAKRLETRLAGRTLVLDARLGGLSEPGLLDAKEDVVPPTLDSETPPCDGKPGWTEARLESVGRRLRAVRIDAELPPGWVREAGWSAKGGEADEPSTEWRIEKLKAASALGDPARTTAQELATHHERTGEEADAIAVALRLSDNHRRMLTAAARLHDAGKDRQLWQDAMGASRDGRRPYAKTEGRRANPALLKIDGRTYRHEFGSLRDAEPELANLEEDLKDLARHLIAAHHGYARPVIAPVDPTEPPSASEQRAREAALRFARLQRQWGPWGLAWWETLLRSADWAASRRLVDEEGA